MNVTGSPSYVSRIERDVGGHSHASMPATYGEDGLATAWCDGMIILRVRRGRYGQPVEATHKNVTCPDCLRRLPKKKG